MMVYTFACPVPCNRIIKVHANTDDDAVKKIIAAGAIGCRNIALSSFCEKGRRHTPALPENRLREIVQLMMESEESSDRM